MRVGPGSGYRQESIDLRKIESYNFQVLAIDCWERDNKEKIEN